MRLNIGEIKIIASQVERDNPDELAWHLLGMITWGKARSGLEYTLEPVLKQPQSFISINAFTDGLRHLLPGLGLRFQNFSNPSGYYLTIDLEIQKIVEQILDRNGIWGAVVVVLDAKNAEILAMDSRPVANPINPAESLQDLDSPFKPGYFALSARLDL